MKTLSVKTNVKEKKGSINRSLKPTLLQDIKRNPWLYLLCLPAILFFVLFAYIPMAGLYIAFVDYRPLQGIWGSAFVGLENFKAFFATNNWITVTGNTLFLNVLFIAATTITSVAIAIMLAEENNSVNSYFTAFYVMDNRFDAVSSDSFGEWCCKSTYYYGRRKNY